MKKCILILMISSIILCCVGCSNEQKSSPILLPSIDEINKISIELIDGTKVSYEDAEYIEQVLSVLTDAKSTNKESVQDVPLNKDFGSIHFECDTKTSTIFYYIENEKYYIEQSYNGIYETDVALDTLFEGVE